jgi:virginiamycin B lyase
MSAPTNGATDSAPAGITEGPDGSIWFTESSANRIGRITPSGAFNKFQLPTPTSVNYSAEANTSDPENITVAPNGTVWFTEENSNQIGEWLPGGAVHEWPVPTAPYGPLDLSLGPDGNLWFTEWRNSGTVGKFNPNNHTTALYAAPVSPAFPGGAAYGGITTGYNVIWFTNGSAIDQIFPFTSPTHPLITPYPVPNTANNFWMEDITVAPNGTVWFASRPSNQIGEYDYQTSSPTFHLHQVPIANSGLWSITTDAYGNVWFTMAGGNIVNQIGELDTTGHFTEYSIPTPTSLPGDITAGPNGSIWFTEGNANKIGELTFGCYPAIH